jgi:hypothetical protein
MVGRLVAQARRQQVFEVLGGGLLLVLGNLAQLLRQVGRFQGSTL